MFNGYDSVNMDAKGRLALPTRYRAPLLEASSGRAVVTQHPYDNCLVLYPLPEWNDVARQVSRLPDVQPAVRYLKRRFLGQATEVEMDGSGRFLIPGELRSLAGLEKRTALMGMLHRLEIWSEEAWTEEQAKNAELDVASMPEEVQSLAF